MPIEIQQKDVPTAAQPSTSSQIISQTIVPQTPATVQVPRQETGEHKGSKRKHKVLAYAAKVYAFAIKCYAEQMPGGWEQVKRLIRQADKKRLHIIAICHYKDIVSDGIWASAIAKSHYHIIIRCVNRKDRVHVYTVLKMLNIVFRPGIDDELWLGHGVESIGDYTGYAMYLTHETRDAIADAKELYDVSELVSNLTPEEIAQVREGYTRVVDSAKRLTTQELEALDRDAKQMGYELKNFEEWYDKQPFIVRSNAKMRTIRESYERGVNMRIDENAQICRLCVYIHGLPNTGKTYAAEQALVGHRFLSIGGGGSGKFDELRVDHEALIIDDDVCPNLLNMSDNKICRAYKRNKNNPAWTGKYLIVTSNLKFDDWVEKCGIRAKNEYGVHTAHYDALLSRFCIGQVLPSTAGYNQLYIQSMSTRGSTEIQQERKLMIADFLQKYNTVIQTYDPAKVNVDYSNIVTDLSYMAPII